MPRLELSLDIGNLLVVKLVRGIEGGGSFRDWVTSL